MWDTQVNTDSTITANNSEIDGEARLHTFLLTHLLASPVGKKTIFIPWTQTHTKEIYIQRFCTYTFCTYANLASSKNYGFRNNPDGT